MKKIFAIVTIILLLSAVCVTVVTVIAKEPQKKECCQGAQKCDKKDGAACCKDAQKDDQKGCEKKACCDAHK